MSTISNLPAEYFYTSVISINLKSLTVKFVTMTVTLICPDDIQILFLHTDWGAWDQCSMIAVIVWRLAPSGQNKAITFALLVKCWWWQHLLVLPGELLQKLYIVTVPLHQVEVQSKCYIIAVWNAVANTGQHHVCHTHTILGRAEERRYTSTWLTSYQTKSQPP